MEGKLDLDLIYRILQTTYKEWRAEGSPCTRLKAQLDILEKMLEKEGEE